MCTGAADLAVHPWEHTKSWSSGMSWGLLVFVTSLYEAMISTGSHSFLLPAPWHAHGVPPKKPGGDDQ